MAGRKSKRIRKRQGGSAASSSKRKKREIVEPSNEIPTQMKIIDLNADCLEQIFKFLDLKNMLNVADSNKSLRSGLEQVYRSKYRRPGVRIGNWCSAWEPQIEIRNDDICIADFVTCLKFLRCFGGLISTLHIDHDKLRAKRRFELDRYLSDYCTESLVSLSFKSAAKAAITGSKKGKPFINVKHLSVVGALGKNLSDFNRWFPNLRHLKLGYISGMTHGQCIEVHIPGLTHFEISFSLYYPQLSNKFGDENVANFIRVNPQLQFLRIDSKYIDPSWIELASGCELKELHINTSHPDFGLHAKEVFHFKHLEKCTMRTMTDASWFTPKEVMVPISSDKLEVFSIELYHFLSNDAIVQFAEQNPALKIMTIHCRLDAEETENLTKLSSLLNNWSISIEKPKVVFKRTTEK